jgi:hypothetical protein
MAEEYKKAAEAAGHEVTLVNVSKKKIAGCLACEYCHGKGNGACIQKDDMQELYPLFITPPKYAGERRGLFALFYFNCLSAANLRRGGMVL